MSQTQSPPDIAARPGRRIEPGVGLLEDRNDNPAQAPEKDTANTDVIVHHGNALALWCRSGAPYDLDRRTLDGYVITFVTDAATMTTAVAVSDARDITADPVCRIHLGVRVPLGFHATWAGDARTGVT